MRIWKKKENPPVRSKPLKIFCPFCEDIRDAEQFGLNVPLFEQRSVTDAGVRPAAQCKTCKSLERERMVRWCIDTQFKQLDGALLQFAPSRALHQWLSQIERLDLTNVDLVPEAYAFAGEVLPADITKLPFDDHRFDFVICSHVMEHIPDDAQAFAEVKRVLKPGGHAIYVVPLVVDGKGFVEDLSVTEPSARLARFGQDDHVRIYDADTFTSRLQKSGMTSRIFDPFEKDPIKATAYGLDYGSVVFVAQHPAA